MGAKLKHLIPAGNHGNDSLFLNNQIFTRLRRSKKDGYDFDRYACSFILLQPNFDLWFGWVGIYSFLVRTLKMAMCRFKVPLAKW